MTGWPLQGLVHDSDCPGCAICDGVVGCPDGFCECGECVCSEHGWKGGCPCSDGVEPSEG